MFEVDYENYVSEEKVALWKELACLHFINREIGKHCKRFRWHSPRTITLADGSRVMQPELHRRLRTLCVRMLEEMPGFGDARKAYVFALTSTSLQQKVRNLLRADTSETLPFLIQAMERVIGHGNLSSERLVHDESLEKLKMLRTGFSMLTVV